MKCRNDHKDQTEQIHIIFAMRNRSENLVDPRGSASKGGEKPMGKYRLVIFDLDGTILDTLEDLYDSLNVALRENGFPERSIQEVRSFVGNGIYRLVQLGLPEGHTEEELNRTLAFFRSYYGEHCLDKTKPYPGISELFERLHREGRLIAVVSNKADSAVQALIARFFPGQIDYVLGERDGIRRKPAPDTVLEAMRRMGVSAGETVYAGDSEVDIQTAANAGVDAVIVSWGFRDRQELLEHGAKVIVDRMEELFSQISQ
jgi:phosphoglycolate phosphatase